MRINSLPSRIVLLGAAFTMLGAPSGALAEPAKAPDPQKIFSQKDANSDGFLTLEEFKFRLTEKALEKADKRFKKLDTDGDGQVSLDEFKAGMQRKPKE